MGTNGEGFGPKMSKSQFGSGAQKSAFLQTKSLRKCDVLQTSNFS